MRVTILDLGDFIELFSYILSVFSSGYKPQKLNNIVLPSSTGKNLVLITTNIHNIF